METEKTVFRKAMKSDVKTVVDIYRAATGSEFCTWDEIYPGLYDAEEDLSAGTLFVLESAGEIIGAVSIVPENEMDDLKCWKVREKAREFARVVIRPQDQGKGLSGEIIKGVIRELRNMGTAAVHIAAAKVNVPALKLYRKCGFDFRGETEMYGNSYYLCEKILSDR